MNILVFDIETIPDAQGARRIFNWPEQQTEDIVNAMSLQRRQEKSSDFQPLHLHQIVAISVVWRSDSDVKVWSLGSDDSDEAEIIQRFFDGIERYGPNIVSWNGSGFDLPVLHYRALKHRISAPKYWETGNNESSFRWNNYISRYHWRHIDLMEVLALYQNRAYAPLDQMASLLGYPGKMGMSGAGVWDAFQAGDIKNIRDYCETDVLNTYLVYLRFEYFRGNFSMKELEYEEDKVRELLKNSDAPHLQNFLSEWGSSES